MKTAGQVFSDQMKDLALTMDDLTSTREVAVLQIPLEQISSDPANPRKSFDEDELAALAQSIRERGLLQPITVRKLGPKNYVIRFGDRRFRAARIAGLESIAAIVTEETADDFDVVDQVLENDQRVDLTVKEMAAAVKGMLDRGMKQKDVAGRLGRDVKTVSRLASVADMPSALTDLLDSVGLRTVYNLYQVWSTSPEKVEAFLRDTLVDEVTRARVDQLVSLSGASALPASIDPVARQIEPEAVKGDEVVGPLERKVEQPSDITVTIDGNGGRLMVGSTVKVLFDGEDAPRSIKVR